jgi:AcrR family transcriptional regulator
MQLTHRQQEIVTASIAIIAASGVQNLTIKNIAAEIKLSEAAIYRHFSGKREILLAILGGFRTHNVPAANQARGQTALDVLQTVFLGHMQRFSETPALASVIFSEEIFQDDTQLAQEVFSIVEENLARIAAMLETGRQDGSVRHDLPANHLALLSMGALRLLVTRWHLSGYSFSLVEEGARVWESLRLLIGNKKG